MKNLILSVLFLVVLAPKVSGQNYKSVVSGDTLYYASQEYNWPYSNTLRMLTITGSALAGTDSVFTLNTGIRLPVDTSNVCLDTLGPSWMGRTFVRTNTGEELFKNYGNETITLKTWANLNDTWVIHTDPTNVEIRGTVSSIDTLSLDLLLDTIKVITMQAYQNGNPVSHYYNNRTIILSKNHGLVEVPEFHEFPYLTPNLYSGVNRGDPGPYRRIDRQYTNRSLLHIDLAKKFQPGNYWQYKDSLYDETSLAHVHILSQNQDSVMAFTPYGPNCAIVQLKTVTYSEHSSFTPPQPPNQIGSYGYHDTLYTVYHTDTICNPSLPMLLRDNIYPETTSARLLPGSPLLLRYYFDFLGDSLALYAQYLDAYHGCEYSPQSACMKDVNNVSGHVDEYRQNLEKFGLWRRETLYGNWGGTGGMEITTFYHYFFKIGNDTFGTPVNMYVLDVQDVGPETALRAYPNPSLNGQFFVNSDKDLSWEVFTIDGKPLVRGEGNTISLGQYAGGLYLLKIRIGARVYVQKLMKG